MRESMISNEPAAFSSEKLKDELGSCIELQKQISDHDQQDADESSQVEQIEVHSYRDVMTQPI